MIKWIFLMLNQRYRSNSFLVSGKRVSKQVTSVCSIGWTCLLVRWWSTVLRGLLHVGRRATTLHLLLIRRRSAVHVHLVRRWTTILRILLHVGRRTASLIRWTHVTVWWRSSVIGIHLSILACECFLSEDFRELTIVHGGSSDIRISLEHL